MPTRKIQVQFDNDRSRLLADKKVIEQQVLKDKLRNILETETKAIVAAEYYANQVAIGATNGLFELRKQVDVLIKQAGTININNA